MSMRLFVALTVVLGNLFVSLPAHAIGTGSSVGDGLLGGGDSLGNHLLPDVCLEGAVRQCVATPGPMSLADFIITYFDGTADPRPLCIPDVGCSDFPGPVTLAAFLVDAYSDYLDATTEPYCPGECQPAVAYADYIVRYADGLLLDVNSAPGAVNALQTYASTVAYARYLYDYARLVAGLSTTPMLSTAGCARVLLKALCPAAVTSEAASRVATQRPYCADLDGAGAAIGTATTGVHAFVAVHPACVLSDSVTYPAGVSVSMTLRHGAVSASSACYEAAQAATLLPCVHVAVLRSGRSDLLAYASWDVRVDGTRVVEGTRALAAIASTL